MMNGSVVVRRRVLGAARIGMLITVIVAAAMLSTAGTVHAATPHPVGGKPTVDIGVGGAKGTQSDTTPCFDTFPDCTSSDPAVSLGFISTGDTSGCTFDGSVTWGDGTSSDASFVGGPNGSVPVTFNHQYTALGSYPVGWAATLTSGTTCVSNSGTFQFTLTVPCPTQSTGVRLPAVKVPVSLSIKPISVRYPALPLAFSAVGGSGNSLCTVKSGEGKLAVYVDTPLASIHVADSVTTAQVSFLPASALPAGLPTCNFSGLRGISNPSQNPTQGALASANNCLLTGTSASTDLYAQWSSPGFVEHPFGSSVSFPATGPLSYYVDVDTLSGTPPVPFQGTLQSIESYIHTTLISNLPMITKLAVIQDPPAHLLITDPLGRTVGIGPNHKMHSFPGAGYKQIGKRSIAWFLAPVPGAYTITASGAPGTAFHTEFTVLQFLGHGSAPLKVSTQWRGTTRAGGTAVRRFALHGKPMSPVLRPRESTTRTRRHEAVRFTLEGSVIPFLPAHVVWTFGDGTHAVGMTVRHRYQVKGSFTPTVTVTNAIGETITVKLKRIRVTR